MYYDHERRPAACGTRDGESTQTRHSLSVMTFYSPIISSSEGHQCPQQPPLTLCSAGFPRIEVFLHTITERLWQQIELARAILSFSADMLCSSRHITIHVMFGLACNRPEDLGEYTRRILLNEEARGASATQRGPKKIRGDSYGINKIPSVETSLNE